MHDTQSSALPPRDNVPAKAYRYAAYRNFTYFVHTRLGKGVRRRIPACVIRRIREQFPAPDGMYVGYKDDGDICSEIDFSWVFQCGEDNENKI